LDGICEGCVDGCGLGIDDGSGIVSVVVMSICHKVERVSNCKIRLKLDTSNMHDCHNSLGLNVGDKLGDRVGDRVGDSVGFNVGL